MSPDNYSPPRGILLALLLLLGVIVPAAMGQANVKGQWTTLSQTTPINPIHAALMKNGKILIVAGSGNCPPSQSGCPSGPPYGPSNASGAEIYDPVAGTFTAFTLSWDMFCNGMVNLPDGRVLVNGGSIQYDPFYGSPKSAIFDPSTNTFTNVQSMAHGRWYPTVTTLGDGRVMTFSGTDENGNTNTTVEIYTVGSGWNQPDSAGWTPPLYPRMHLLPSGKVFYSGQGTSSAIFDPSSLSWTQNVANTIYGGQRSYGTSVLLPLTPANGYDPQVMIMGGNSPATATTEIIDLNASPLKWKSGPSMSQARSQMNAVILPNGKILAMGGSVNDEDVGSLSLNADLYDPVAKTFSSAGQNVYERLYHSVALLLPDATVWLTGGNPSRGTYEPHMEIYKPAYLFNSSGGAATRPTISSAPSSISWGNGFTVTTPDAASISSVVLVRDGAVTHSFNMDQRLVGISFTAGSGSLTVTAPPTGNIAPPGYYMLFLLNSSGVPSVAKFVQLITGGGGNPAPTVTSISPTSGTTAGGTPVTVSGTGFLAGASLSLGGTAASNVVVSNSTTITATTPAHAAGAVTVTVTNTDSQSGSLNNGYTYSSGGGGGGSIGFVQVNSATPVNNASPVSVAYPLAQTAGNLNIVVVGWNDTTATVSSVVDSRGNTYTLAVGPTSG
ncbi:MAG TPA: galactose oxidase-like domain-containing protein, partial [Terriglobales bacterium]|nr:galactose oxidase-like domain-containing protein [Terriglobales bacterium]